MKLLKNRHFIRRIPLNILITAYCIWLIFNYRYHLIDHVNLAIHEAGHLLFRPFGDTLYFLGGSIFQLLIPLACATYFAFNKQTYSASICGIWAGQNLMYIAVYARDAKTMALPLVGGHIHDYNWLFRKWGVLDQATSIGNTLHIIASIIVIISLLLLYKTSWQPSEKGTLHSPEYFQN